jgi:hypothetical protein
MNDALKRGQVFVRAKSPAGTWHVCDVVDLDEASFRLWIQLHGHANREQKGAPELELRSEGEPPPPLPPDVFEALVEGLATALEHEHARRYLAGEKKKV